jgi:hypothetical protein
MPNIDVTPFADDVTPKKAPFFLSYDEMANLPPADWLVDRAVPRHAKTLMFGASNTFKSFLAVDLACCVATGTDWHGHHVRQGNVVYIATEGASGVGRLRIRDWMNHHNIPEQDRRNIFLRNMETWITDPADVAAFIDAVRHTIGEIALFVVDVGAGTMAGSESDDETAKTWVAGLETIIRELSCAALCITHTGWADQTRARGHTHIWGSFDTRLQVEGDKDKRTSVLRVNRHKDADSLGSWGFRLEPVVVQIGESTLVPEFDETVDTNSSGAKKLTSANHKAAQEALQQALDKHGEPSPGFTGMPSNATVIKRGTWETYGSPKMSGADTKRQNENFGRAVTALHDKGLVGFQGEYVWSIST